MTPQELRDHIADLNPDALFADGLDDAMIGYVEQATSTILACYDREKCIDIFVKRDGMTPEDAEEFFEFNTAQAYVGPNTPVFFTNPAL